MLPRNIDLTERSDFGLSEEIRRGTYRRLVNMGDIMTRDDYEALSWYEGIFGRRCVSEHEKLFDYDGKYWKELGSHCVRCGKEFRIPWKKRFDLCIECDEITSHDGRIPWKSEQLSGLRISTRDDLFSLR